MAMIIATTNRTIVSALELVNETAMTALNTIRSVNDAMTVVHVKAADLKANALMCTDERRSLQRDDELARLAMKHTSFKEEHARSLGITDFDKITTYETILAKLTGEDTPTTTETK